MTQSMTRKQALAVLHSVKSFLYESQNYRNNEPLRMEVLEAFNVLARAIHGKPDGYCISLCDRCHLHYGPHWIEYRQEGQDYDRHMSVCPSCLQEVKTTLTLISIDWDPVQPIDDASQSVVSALPVECEA